jgi:hypothetical protein
MEQRRGHIDRPFYYPSTKHIGSRDVDTWTDPFNETYMEQGRGHMDQRLQINIYGVEMWTHGPTPYMDRPLQLNIYGAETWTHGPTPSTKHIWSMDVDTWI